MNLLPIRPWRVSALDETGGYDCITPGVDVLDSAGNRMFTIDAKDHGWSGYCTDPAKMYEHEVAKSNVRLKIMDIAHSICVAMNRAPANWGPWV